MGETIVSTRRLTGIEMIGADRVRVGAGMTIEALNRAIEAAGRYYPPSPTFSGACVGGTVATNAAGAATFKYGTTRDWVDAITVVLPSGDVLDIERGATRARDGRFRLELGAGPIAVPVPEVPNAGVAQALGWLLCRARHGSDRSVHRLGRDAGHRDRRHPSRAPGSSGHVRGAGSIPERGRRAAVRGRSPRRRARNVAHVQPPRRRRVGHRIPGRSLTEHRPGRPRRPGEPHRPARGGRSRAARDARTARRHNRGGRLRPDRPSPRRRSPRRAAGELLRDAARRGGVRRRRDGDARRRVARRRSLRRCGRQYRPGSISASARRSAPSMPPSRKLPPTSRFRSIASKNCFRLSGPTPPEPGSTPSCGDTCRTATSIRMSSRARLPSGERRARRSRRSAAWPSISAACRWRSTASAVTRSSRNCCANCTERMASIRCVQ